MSDATVQDELAFEELSLETKELVQRLADSGYFGDDCSVDCAICDDFEAEINNLNFTISELREEIEELKEEIEELENA